VVIGHEMTHGFDDQGRHYDKVGNMVDWWTASDGENFNKRADQYAAFFSNIKVLHSLLQVIDKSDRLSNRNTWQLSYSSHSMAFMSIDERVIQYYP